MTLPFFSTAAATLPFGSEAGSVGLGSFRASGDSVTDPGNLFEPSGGLLSDAPPCDAAWLP